MRRISLMLGVAAIVGSQAFWYVPEAVAATPQLQSTSQAFMLAPSALAATDLKQVDGGMTAARPQAHTSVKRAPVRGATVLLTESFTDATFPPTGWTGFNVDTEAPEWARLDTSSNTAPASANHAWNVTIAQDGWLVTPPVSIDSGATATLSFFDGGQWMQDYGYSGVWVSTASCVPGDGDFVELAEIDDSPGSGSTSTWRATPVELDLSAFAGETICVGFRYMGTNAHRWMIDDVEIAEISGGPTDPVIDTAPASFSFSVTTGMSDSDELTIANVGGGSLDWDIETDSLPTGMRSHDPLLDEPLAVPNFTVISPPNGGLPQVFTIPGGVLTSGRVVGFSFEGTVAGVTGNSSWASDMCMTIQGPDGSSFSVGGFSAAIPGCTLNNWDFQGGGSNDDGTYSSEHDDVWPFPPGAEDDGDWTLTFVNGWNSDAAATMDWSDVTVTLHKITPPEPCDDPNLLSWLTVNPDAGSTLSGSPSLVDVLIDADGVAPGTYEAFLCINSNDSVGNELVVLPVELTVLAPEITVEPTSISAAADPGDSTTATLTIGNAGAGDLLWEIEEAPEAASPRAHFPSLPRQVRSGSGGSPLAEPVDLAWLEKMELTQAEARNQHSRSAARGGGFAVPAYTTTGFSRSDYVTFDALVPGALTSIVDPGPGTIFAQTFIDNDFSQHFFIATGGGTLAQNAYGYVDTGTGAVNTLGVLAGVPATGTWTSASWDRTTGTVYAVLVPAAGDNQLWAINIGAGTGTLIGAISGGGIAAGGIIIAIAVSPDGLMYGVEIIDDVLVAIDKTSGAGSVIGALGVNANFAQDMDFDASTGTLYWAGYLGGGNSQMFTVDLSTGAATSIGAVQDGAELLSFSVAIAGGNCSDPADVPWLSVDVDNGSIPSGGPDDEVEVTLDATSLSDGVYNASLCVLSNDPARPLVEVPVEFVVGVGLGTEADLALGLFGVPGTVAAGGSVSLVATVANFGPAAATDVEVELELPAEFSFVSGGLIEGSGDWSCGASGQTVTCELVAGDLPVNSFAAVLQVNVSVDAGAASGTVQTDGTVSSSNFNDPNPGNNTASTTTTIVGPPPDLIFANGFECAPGLPDCVAVCEPVQLLQDPSFEATDGGSFTNPFWPDFSAAFGGVLCNAGLCGTGGGTAGPRTGDFWAWLGGTAAAETAWIEQAVVIPAGAPRHLNFWLWVGSIAGTGATLEVRVDGNAVETIAEPGTAEPGYSQRTVDLSAFADDASHTIRFHYQSPNGGNSNFNLDDVTLECDAP